jgi:hypothetical protein
MGLDFTMPSKRAALLKRILPIPPSTYVHGATISVKIAIALVVMVLATLLTMMLICCVCIKRSRRKSRAKRLAKEREESRALPAKINHRNARFYGPGIDKDLATVEDLEMGSFIDQKDEMQAPERAWVRWKEVLRGEVRGGVRYH